MKSFFYSSSMWDLVKRNYPAKDVDKFRIDYHSSLNTPNEVKKHFNFAYADIALSHLTDVTEEKVQKIWRITPQTEASAISACFCQEIQTDDDLLDFVRDILIKIAPKSTPPDRNHRAVFARLCTYLPMFVGIFKYGVQAKCGVRMVKSLDEQKRIQKSFSNTRLAALSYIIDPSLPSADEDESAQFAYVTKQNKRGGQCCFMYEKPTEFELFCRLYTIATKSHAGITNNSATTKKLTALIVSSITGLTLGTVIWFGWQWYANASHVPVKVSLPPKKRSVPITMYKYQENNVDRQSETALIG